MKSPCHKVFLIVLVAAALSNNNIVSVQAKMNVWTRQHNDADDDDGVSNSTNTTESISTRITGGTRVREGAYPFFSTVALGSSVLCGASLIHEDFLLSAAHCSRAFSGRIRIGIDNMDTDKGIEQRLVDRRIRHPAYNSYNLKNDIMLLRLDKSVSSRSIKPVRYEQKSPVAPPEGETLTVIGMGSERDSGPVSGILEQVTVQARTNVACKNQYGSLFQQTTQFCAGVDGGGKDSCSGDSGGPIIDISTRDGTQVQVGIVSFGAGCGLKTHSGVYTRVGAYADWIQDQICRYSRNPPEDCREDQINNPSGESDCTCS